MIQIRHAELAFIQENYTKSIVPKIINKCEIVERLIELLQSPKKTTYDDIKGYYYPFTSALGGVLNDNKLGIKNKGELLRKIENLRVTSCYKIRIIHIQNKIVFLKDKNNLIKLISSLPFNLKELQNQYLKNIELLFSDLLIKFLFDYEYFYRDNIAPIAENLNLIVCPYCNRNYITHIKGKNKKRVIGPTFDHFFYKAENPLLALSFYNLIPSCSICNSNLKNKKKFELEFNLHPYLNEMGQDAKFDFDLKLVKTGLLSKIIFKPTIDVVIEDTEDNYKRLVGTKGKKDSGSIKVFELDAIYESHFDSVEEIYNKFDKNNPFYINSIDEIISNLGTTEAEFYRFYFGNYYNYEDFHKRPLAKLSRDIYEKMKNINSQI